MLPVEAPTVPTDMKEIFNSSVDCSVQDFYIRFVSGDFQKRLHLEVSLLTVFSGN